MSWSRGRASRVPVRLWPDYGRTTTPNVTTYCASLSSASAAQQADGQVADAPVALYGSDAPNTSAVAGRPRRGAQAATKGYGDRDVSSAGLRAWPTVACFFLAVPGYRAFCGSGKRVRGRWLLAWDSRDHRRSAYSVGLRDRVQAEATPPPRG